MKIRGKWVYWYRAVDREGRIVHFRLSARRDVGSAKAFSRNAITSHGPTLDRYAASHRAVREMKAHDELPDDTTLLSSKYLKSLIE